MLLPFSIKRKAYDLLPLFVKHSVCSIPFSWLAGKKYRQIWNRGNSLDSADRTAVLDYQGRLLGEILKFAVTEVPAYKYLAGIVHKNSPFEALKAFPIVSKDTIQSNQDEFLPISFRKIPHYETTTGGTSGNQLKIYLDNASQAMEMAFMHRQWQRVGYKTSDRKATFRGVSFPNLREEIYWQHNPAYNELQFSPFHMSDQSLPLYIEKIIKFNPSFFHGYPSAIDFLAEYVIRNNLQSKMPKLKAIFLGSEGCSISQRVRIQTAFKARVFTWYGHSERTVLAGECECSDVYHHIPDYGILEIIDSNGNACSVGEKGEIVGTGLFNFSMPLIRYKTEDFATRLEPFCECCGRSWDRFSNVDGRWKQDMIYGRNGSKFSLASINMHGNIFDHIKRFQYHQTEPGVCTLKIVPASTFELKMLTEIKSSYRNKVGNGLDIEIQIVDDIPLTARGKLKLLVSSLNR
jgi:phenylacetate-CoA ligase